MPRITLEDIIEFEEKFNNLDKDTQIKFLKELNGKVYSEILDNLRNKNDLFDFEFDKKEKCWSVTGYYSKSEEVIFPESYKNKPIKKVACLFSPNQKKRIKRVIIPEGYTSIGTKAFNDCTKLKSIELPQSLTSIGEWAFQGCTELTNIKLPESLTSIGNYAFLDCEGLASINFPDNLTSIGEWAFQGCTGLKNIKLPKNLISIGYRTIDEDGGDMPLGSICDLGDCTFAGCTGLTNIEFPEGLTFIGTEIFRDCKGLTNIKLPESLTSIGDGAFSGCTGLTDVKLPENLAFVGNRVFEGCKNLAGINRILKKYRKKCEPKEKNMKPRTHEDVLKELDQVIVSVR